MRYLLAFCVVAAGSCKTISPRNDSAAHTKYLISMGAQYCPIQKANQESIRVCLQGADTSQQKSDEIKKAATMWMDAIRSKYAQAKAQIKMTCEQPDITVNIAHGYGTPMTYLGMPATLSIYTGTEFGNILHEFGHAIPCLDDTYVGGSAGYCVQGQPKSVMCYGLLINELTEDDVAGAISQYEAIGLHKKNLNPDGDDDHDSILNKDDRCAGTPANATVWKDRGAEKIKWLGCAEGQTPSLF